MSKTTLNNHKMAVAAGVALFSASVMALPQIEFSARTSTYAVTGAESAADLLNQHGLGSALACEGIPLPDFTGVSTRPSRICGQIGTGNRDLTFLIDTRFSLASPHHIDLQIGTDWGRGGGVIIDGIIDYLTTDDIWWGGSWTSGDVLTSSLDLSAGLHQIQWIGFEGCCNGQQSIRFAADGGFWQPLSVANLDTYSIPAPPVLALLGIGLAGLWLRRK